MSRAHLRLRPEKISYRSFYAITQSTQGETADQMIVDLPEAPTKYGLITRLKTAKALGLSVPPSSTRTRRREDRVERIFLRCRGLQLAHRVPPPPEGFGS